MFNFFNQAFLQTYKSSTKTFYIQVFKLAQESKNAKKGEDVLPPALEDLDKMKSPDKFVPNFNRREVRMGEAPSANGYCTARGLAR